MIEGSEPMSEKNYIVEQAEAIVGVEEYLTDFVDVEKFLGFCKECSNYEINWGCPPFDFDVEKFWGKYKTLHLYARFLISKDKDGKALIEGLFAEKEKFAIELLAKEKAVSGSMALSCGSCKVCEICNRIEGKPCLHPEYMRYSIEALGGDVAKTAERLFGKPILWVKDGIAPEYLMLIGGVLSY